MGENTNRTTFLRGHHNKELKTCRHVIWLHKQLFKVTCC